MAKTKKHEMVRYDEENDVLYLLVNQTKVAKTISLDDLRLVDYDNNNEPVGIEFISASDGLDLSDAPAPTRIRELLDEAGIDFPIHA
jgi:uncharacterized protein YuzE